MSELKSVLLGLALGALAALALGLWARARLQEVAERLAVSEHGRQQALQFNTGARKQIEAMQVELAEMRQLLARRGVALPPRAAPMALPEQVPEPAADGFQATQIVPHAPG